MQNPIWQPGPPDPSKTLTELLYIDSQNRICTVKLTAQELRDFQYQPLAWRDWTPVPEPEPEPVLLLTTYWNYRNGKFWPWNARKPPNPKLKNYLKVRLWQQPNGDHRIEYSVLDTPNP
jgi:hypothetical protein